MWRCRGALSTLQPQHLRWYRQQCAPSTQGDAGNKDCAASSQDDTGSAVAAAPGRTQSHKDLIDSGNLIDWSQLMELFGED